MLYETETRLRFLENVGIAMMGAARTAPKGKGRDTLEISMLSGKELEGVAAEMKKIAAEKNMPGFERDAGNVLASSFVVLIGTSIKPAGLAQCSMCGFANCGEKPAQVPCQINTTDLGIAIGSAVAAAADNKADCRVMYTIGQAALRMKLFAPSIAVAFGIPLSCTSKSPFFDR